MMKKQAVALVLIGIGICSFKIPQRDDLLAFINHINKLKLVYQDDKCGEWGGDRETITLYRTSLTSEIYADYLKETRNCKKPNSNKHQDKKNKLAITEADKQIIIEAINQLSTGILSNQDLPAHAGLYCEVTLSDSSIVIKDFPSIKWTKFEQLRQRLIKE